VGAEKAPLQKLSLCAGAACIRKYVHAAGWPIWLQRL